MAINVGTEAPDFTLKSKAAAGVVDVKLSDNWGKRNTVLLFFPLAFTGVCTREMCEISGGLNVYKQLNAEVYGLSVDSPFAQEAWAQKEKITLTLVSDLNKQVAEAYGVLLPDLLGLGRVSARAAFVIDRQGIVRYAEVTPTPKDLPSFQAIQAALGKLK